VVDHDVIGDRRQGVAVEGSNVDRVRVTGPEAAEAAWRATAQRAAESAFFFDFDGTLAPIGDDPAVIQPAPGVVSAIAELSHVVGHVAIVSARPVGFLRDRFSLLSEDVDLHGLYGLEVHRAGETHTDPTALEWAPAMARLAERARAELPDRDLVEYKRLSVALHYRSAPHLREQVERWAHREAERTGLRVQSGRMVVELKPPGERDKGTVIAEAVRSVGCAWYFGDDLSDLKAFRALRDRAAGSPDFLAVCVAVANPETGRELSAAADFTLGSPDDLAGFLRNGLAVLENQLP
jgi:trehalose 6-phosphate phosphatase